MTYIDSYVQAIERDFFQSSGNINMLLENSRDAIKEQALQAMDSLSKVYSEDNPEILNTMDKIVFFTEGAPAALLARARCLIANKKRDEAARDLRVVVDKGNEQERLLSNQLLKDL